ncbi:rhomboid-related protein 4 isoform X2 [Arvicola amphibius]|uniref:rhomboid-related protein 4 isoform X2 n=1 Tax=Arvicola amphibius TaxID=1047088 RepID=UPI0018E324DA|nr:rhomboid-related protein 4 isoform X2 [Arvicola amphibius]
MQRRSRGVNVGLLMLLSQVFHVGINNIPPVTLATLALNVWLFLNPLKPLHYSCISVEKCYQQKDWQRLLLSPLHHADDWHLYFNMVSMLWKGIKLERRLGSRWFGYIITTFSLLTGVVYLLLQFTLAEFMNEPDFRRNCAVGFSGVLFALKVLSNHYCPGGFVNIMGFPVPNRFACWAELIAIHFCTPGSGISREPNDKRKTEENHRECERREVGCGKPRAKIKENQRDFERSILSMCGTASHVARLQSNSFLCDLNPSKVVTGHSCSSQHNGDRRSKRL